MRDFGYTEQEYLALMHADRISEAENEGRPFSFWTPRPTYFEFNSETFVQKEKVDGSICMF